MGTRDATSDSVRDDATQLEMIMQVHGVTVILFWNREGWNGSGVIQDQFRWLPRGSHKQKRIRSSPGMNQVGGTGRSEPCMMIQGLIGDVTLEALGYAAGPSLADQAKGQDA